MFQSSSFLALAVMVCFSLLFAGVFHVSERAKARAVLRHANRSAQLFVTGVFREIIHTLSVLEADPEIRNGAALGPEARDRVLSKYRAHAHANEAIEFVYSGYSDGSMMIDPDVWEVPEGFDPTVRPWYVAAMRSAPMISVGVPYQEYVSREWMVSTSKALRQSDGRYGGVIAIDYAIDDMVAAFLQFTDYATGQTYVIDNEGQIILHRDESLLGSPAAHILEVMAGAEQGSFTYRADDGARLAHFSPAPLTGWTIITDVSRNEVLRPILQRILAAIGLSGIVALALGLAQSVYLSQRLIRPLAVLGKNLRTLIESGAGSAEAHDFPANEIGIIAGEIGELAAGEIEKRTRALRESEAQLLELGMAVEQSVDGIAFSDMAGNIRFVNQAWSKAHGYSADELSGKHLSVFHTREQLEKSVIPFNRQMIEAGTNTGEIWHTRKDGTAFPMHMTTAVVKDAEGNPFGFLAVGRDVSEEYQRHGQQRFDNRFRILVSEISARFVQVRDDRSFDEAVDKALASLGNLLGTDRSYLFRISDDLATSENTHEWCAEGIAAQRGRSRPYPSQTYPLVMASLRSSKPLRILDVAAMSPGAEKEAFQAQDIQSLLCLPIHGDQEMLAGFMGFDAVRAPRDWPEEPIPMLQAVAEIIGGTIMRLNALGELAAREALFRCLVDNSYDLIWMLNADAVFAYASPSWKSTLGHDPSDMVDKAFHPLVHPDDAAVCENYMASVLDARHSLPGPQYRVKHADGSWRWHDARITPVFAQNGALLHFVGISRDVTDQKKQEQFSELNREVLQVLYKPGDVQASIRQVLTSLKTYTGVDAVGLRLQHEEDFPFLAQDGFSEDFLLTENSLIERDKQGGICRSADGLPRLECTCGLVLSGKSDSSNPLFTPGGSAWTNDSFPLLEVPAGQDPRHHPRNQCIHQGYASIALIPIRSANHIVGLLQLNCRRKDAFSLATVEGLEGMAAHIGSALQRKQIEDALHKNVNQLTRINNLMMGREMRVLELKKEINALRKQIGQMPRYKAVKGEA